MPGKILGLDIGEDSVTAVQVISGFKGFSVTACMHLSVDETLSLENALSHISDEMDLRSDNCISSVPPHELLFRNIRFPFKDKKKIRKALPFEIETLGTLPSEDIIVDFSFVSQTDQSEILAASAKKAFIAGHLAMLNKHGFNPDILDIRCVPTILWLMKHDSLFDSGVFIDIGRKHNTLILFHNKHIVLIRSLSIKDYSFSATDFIHSADKNRDSLTIKKIEPFLKSLCASISQTIHSFGRKRIMEINPEQILYTGIFAQYPATGDLLRKYLGIPATQVNLCENNKIQIAGDVSKIWNPVLMDNALALALHDSRKSSGFDFRRDEFAVAKRYQGVKKELRRIIVSLVIIFLFLFADIGVDYYFLHKRYASLMQKKIEMFKQTFPDIERIVDPVNQMRIKINEIKKTSVSLPGVKTDKRILDLLKDISERIPGSQNILVTGMIIDQETIRISGETESFNTVDSIKGELEASVYFENVAISSAKLDRDGKNVQFEMKLNRIR